MGDCKLCKKERWLSCAGKEHYEQSDLVYCPLQIVWILDNAAMLNDGKWPPNPAETGYTDAPSKRVSRNAPFVSPKEAIMEVERRLEHCRLDGMMVYLYYAFGFDEYLLSKYYRARPEEIKHRIEAVVWHISGWNFKKHPYRRWLAERNYQNYRELAVV